MGARGGVLLQGKRDTGLTLGASARYVRGVGVVRARQLERLGVRVVEDLLLLRPHSYLERGTLVSASQARLAQRCAVRGMLLDVQVIAPRGHARRGTAGRVVATLGDARGTLLLTWFHAPWVARRLRVGEEAVVSGEVSSFGGRLQMLNPQLETSETLEELRAGRPLPVYPLTAGLRQGVLRRMVRDALDQLRGRPDDPLPEPVRQELQLPTWWEALEGLHRPAQAAQAAVCQRRLAFDEALALQLAAGARRRSARCHPACVPLPSLGNASKRFVDALPFALTAAQRRVLAEIRRDLAGPEAMVRLLQGEVGSGKTLVAVIAMLWIAEASAQAAFLAPTEVLARQHALRHLPLLQHVGIHGALLTASTPPHERAQTLEALRAGELGVIFGTHALLEADVVFARLGLAVVDEQHRFGVQQRARLTAPGAHLLVMSATPIPRTLALTLYADLDLSVLDQVPAGRPPVATKVVQPAELPAIYQDVRRRSARGEGCYLVFPAVDDSEDAGLAGAVAAHQELIEGPLRGIPVGLLHGRLPAREKQSVSADFEAGALHALVATTVVEVGLDVPRATLMVVHHAERFGLAQLHQLRGRVGRGPAGGDCLLVASEEAGDSAVRRLAQVAATHDGFALAEQDLRERGMGDLRGTRQHGVAPLRFLRPLEDASLVERARALADALLAADPDLAAPEHRALRAWLDRLGARSPLWAVSG